MQRWMPSSLFVLILVLSLTGCATAPAPAPTTTAPQSSTATTPVEAPAASEGVDLPPSIHWARSSAEHDVLYRQIFLRAAERLEEIAAGWPAGTWAVSLDADETVLDNSLYQKERWEETGSFDDLYSPESWNAWVMRQEAPPLPGAVEFLGKIRELGGVIAIVTNRRESQCPATEENFRKEDMPFDIMLCRGETGEKEPRWARIEAGTASPAYGPLTLVMWLGDNIEDFPERTQELRFGDTGDFAPFGRIYFNLPNPMYGSWQDNPGD